MAPTALDILPLSFDEHGVLKDPASLSNLKERAKQATDAIFLAHGFRNNESDATGLYQQFLASFQQHLARPEFHALAARRLVVAGVYWPSKAFQESFPPDALGLTEAVEPAIMEREIAWAQLDDLQEEVPAADAARLEIAKTLLDRLPHDRGAQDQFVAAVLSVLRDSEPDATEGLERVRSQSGSAVLGKLRAPVLGEPEVTDGVESIGSIAGAIEGSIFSAVAKFLNLATWYLMKDRSGIVGATGLASAVRSLHESQSDLRIHLAGHSLGARLVTSCAKALTQAPQVRPDSLTLLEGAFSHYGFSPNNGDGVPGFFREVIERHAVKGPLMATFSFQDDVVGAAYAIASRVALDNTEAIGDESDPYGGLGRNGCQKTTEASFAKLHAAGVGGPYQFRSGIVNCLDGSGGLIKNHGDVFNPDVTYAFASVLAAT